MSRRRRQGLSPSLFPFLAVLVCTLGTLILLLALVAQNSTDAAEQNARAQQRAKDQQTAKAAPTVARITRESAAGLLRDEEFRVQQLVAVRDQQTADIEKRRDEMTHVEDHIARLRQKLKRLSDEVQQATSDTAAPTISAADISAIQDEIESEKKALERLREESKDETPRVVIVPHKGPNGTARRPVYIECKEDGVTVWPEGSTITLEQLENTNYSANPLDAALRTVRMHAMKTYGDAVPPYPLLVVRPDGIETYAVARRAMREWDDQFGYELVPGEVKLAFAKPDANLKRRLDIAINAAVAEQRVRVAMTQRIGRGGRSGASGAHVGGPAGRGSLPTLSAADLDRTGRANGFRQHRDNAARYGQSSRLVDGSYGRRGPQVGSVNSNSYAGSNEISDSGAAARRMAAQMEAAAREMRTTGPATRLGPTARGGSGSSLGETPPQPNSESGLRSPMGNHYADLAQDSRSGQQIAAANQGMPQSSDALSSDVQAMDSQLLETQLAGPQNIDRQSASSPSANGQVGSEPRNDTGESGLVMPELGKPGDSTGSAGTKPQQVQDATANSQSTGTEQQRTEDSSSAGSESSAEGTSTAAPTTVLDSSAVSQLNSPLSSSSQSASGNPSAMSGQQSSSEEQPPDMQPPDMQSPMGPTIDLVKREGRDWALPRSVAGMPGNEIIRTLRVQCYHDRYILLPAKNGGATEVFSFFNGDVNRATLELATALRDRVEQWGPALPGGRWQPRLEVQIKPHSEMRFHQMRTLMNGSGIELVGRKSP